MTKYMIRGLDEVRRVFRELEEKGIIRKIEIHCPRCGLKTVLEVVPNGYRCIRCGYILSDKEFQELHKKVNR